MLNHLSAAGAIELEDLLGDAMSSAPLDSVALGRFELRGPWGMRFDAGDVAGVHVVVSGSCVLRANTGRVITLDAGDVVMVPRGSAHSLCHDRSIVPKPFSEIASNARAGVPGTWEYGTGAVTTTLICGVYRFDATVDHPIVGLLPKHVVSKASERDPESSIPALVSLLTYELRGYRPGARTMIARTLDMLFVEVVRDWAARQPKGDIGWLGALREPRIASVLVAMHQRPGDEWTLTELARRAGMSETTLKRQFRSVVGETPLAYLARLRIDHSALLLRTTALAIAEIATRVGYQNEFSFGRAFKRLRRVAPGRFRASMRRESPVFTAAAREHQSSQQR